MGFFLARRLGGPARRLGGGLRLPTPGGPSE